MRWPGQARPYTFSSFWNHLHIANNLTIRWVNPFSSECFAKTTEHHHRCCFRKYFENITSKCLDQHLCKWSICTHSHTHIRGTYCVANWSNLLHIIQYNPNKVYYISTMHTNTYRPHSFMDQSDAFELDAYDLEFWFRIHTILNYRIRNVLTVMFCRRKF